MSDTDRSGEWPKTDYSLAMVTWQQAMCQSCGEPLDMRGLTIIETCSSLHYQHHYYCYTPPPGLRITHSHLRHIDRTVPSSKVQAFLRRLDYLVETNWVGDVSIYSPKGKVQKVVTPLVEAFKYLEVREMGVVVPLVCMKWYQQSIRDEVWSHYIELYWPSRPLCSCRPSEPLKLFFLRVLKTHCSDCLQELSPQSFGLKSPTSPQPLCLACAKAPNRALLSFHLLSKHYHCSYAGLRQAGVQPMFLIHGTSFAFACQAHAAILALRKQRKGELIAYLRQSKAPKSRLQQAEALTVTTDFPLYRDLFEKRAQGYIYNKTKRADQSLNDYLASFVLR